MVVQATRPVRFDNSILVVKGHRNGGSSNEKEMEDLVKLVVKGHRNGGSSNSNDIDKGIVVVVKGHRNGGSSNH